MVLARVKDFKRILEEVDGNCHLSINMCSKDPYYRLSIAMLLLRDESIPLELLSYKWENPSDYVPGYFDITFRSESDDIYSELEDDELEGVILDKIVKLFEHYDITYEPK